MDSNIKKFKQLALKSLKSKKSVEKGQDMCRDITAVGIIYDHKKIKFNKKVELLDRYIPGLGDKIASSKEMEIDLLNAKNEYLKKQAVNCQDFLKSIGVIDPKDIKKFMDDLLGTKPKVVSVPVKQRRKSLSTGNLASSGTVKLVKKITLKHVRTPSYEAPVLPDSARNSVINAGTLMTKSPIDMD